MVASDGISSLEIELGIPETDPTGSVTVKLLPDETWILDGIFCFCLDSSSLVVDVPQRHFLQPRSDLSWMITHFGEQPSNLGQSGSLGLKVVVVVVVVVGVVVEEGDSFTDASEGLASEVVDDEDSTGVAGEEELIEGDKEHRASHADLAGNL